MNRIGALSIRLLLGIFCMALFGGIAAADTDANKVEETALEQQPEEQSEQVQSVEEDVQERVDEAAHDRREQILAEAEAAISETRNALRALDEEKPEEALAALERTIGKLELLLARDSELGLAPVDVNVASYDVYASPETIRESIALAQDHLKQGKVQEARRLLKMLASEVVVSVTSIPLATYPDAIKKAVPLVDDGSIDAAKAVLQGALNTLVITDYVSALPLYRAEALLARAETLTEQAERSEEQSKELAGLLEAVRTQMEVAELLGYGNKEDFETVEEQLVSLESRTETGDSGEGWFEGIKKTLSGLF